MFDELAMEIFTARIIHHDVEIVHVHAAEVAIEIVNGVTGLVDTSSAGTLEPGQSVVGPPVPLAVSMSAE